MPRLPPELGAQKNEGTGDADRLNALSQRDNIAELDQLCTGDWTVAYEYHASDSGSKCWYSALLTDRQAKKALSDFSWNLSIGDGAPGFSQTYRGGTEVTKYEKFVGRGIEPIVYVRDFHGLKPRQFDISEEFRLFHNLYHGRHSDTYIIIDNAGNDAIAVEVTSHRVRIRTILVRQYIAARQLHLAIFFDHRTKSNIDLKIAKQVLKRRDVINSDRCYSFHVGDAGGTFSRLVGKRLIAPPPMEESGIWPFEVEKSAFEDFIIGTV
jgi:hypothetical protein